MRKLHTFPGLPEEQRTESDRTSDGGPLGGRLQEQSAGRQVPIINTEAGRRQSIIYNTPAIFEIAQEPQASYGTLEVEVDFFDEIYGDDFMYYEVAHEVGIDPNLLAAIAYMEASYGCRDHIDLWSDPWNTPWWNSSFRPMNIHYGQWKPLASELGYLKEDVDNFTRPNVHVAAVLLKRIEERVRAPSVEKIASLYHFLGADKTMNYGDRVRYIYDHKSWIK